MEALSLRSGKGDEAKDGHLQSVSMQQWITRCSGSLIAAQVAIMSRVSPGDHLRFECGRCGKWTQFIELTNCGFRCHQCAESA